MRDSDGHSDEDSIVLVHNRNFSLSCFLERGRMTSSLLLPGAFPGIRHDQLMHKNRESIHARSTVAVSCHASSVCMADKVISIEGVDPGSAPCIRAYGVSGRK